MEDAEVRVAWILWGVPWYHQVLIRGRQEGGSGGDVRTDAEVRGTQTQEPRQAAAFPQRVEGAGEEIPLEPEGSPLCPPIQTLTSRAVGEDTCLSQ